MKEDDMLISGMNLERGLPEQVLDKKDRIMQKACPTVMVPAHSPLPGITPGSYRFLMASDGLWIEALAGWGHFRYPLWISQRPLPYGPLESMTELTAGAVPTGLIELCRKEALEKARFRKEWAGWIVWREDAGYEYLPLEILQETGISVQYRFPVLPSGTWLAMDLHSHPFDMAHFSDTDDHDDRGGIHYSGVFSFDADLRSNLTLRLCLEGFFFE